MSVIHLSSGSVSSENIDVEFCFNVWKELQMWNKRAWRAQTLFQGYLDYEEDGLIQKKLKEAADLIQGGSVWTGDVSSAAANKIMEIHQEQQAVQDKIKSIRAAVVDYCDKKSEQAQQDVFACERCLSGADKLVLQVRKNRYQ